MESKTELELFLHQTPKSDLEHPFFNPLSINYYRELGQMHIRGKFINLYFV